MQLLMILRFDRGPRDELLTFGNALQPSRTLQTFNWKFPFSPVLWSENIGCELPEPYLQALGAVSAATARGIAVFAHVTPAIVFDRRGITIRTGKIEDRRRSTSLCDERQTPKDYSTGLCRLSGILYSHYR
jgi:hypothetical protein